MEVDNKIIIVDRDDCIIDTTKRKLAILEKIGVLSPKDRETRLNPDSFFPKMEKAQKSLFIQYWYDGVFSELEVPNRGVLSSLQQDYLATRIPVVLLTAFSSMTPQVREKILDATRSVLESKGIQVARVLQRSFFNKSLGASIPEFKVKSIKELNKTVAAIYDNDTANIRAFKEAFHLPEEAIIESDNKLYKIYKLYNPKYGIRG